MTQEKIFLPWPEVCDFLDRHLYAKYKWPEGTAYLMTPQNDGLLVEKKPATSP